MSVPCSIKVHFMRTLNRQHGTKNINPKQECIPVGCVPTADTPSIPHLPLYTTPCEQTYACENLTFLHTSYAAGNNDQDQKLREK